MSPSSSSALVRSTVRLLSRRNFAQGEVTPGLSQSEYELRRYKLASLIEAQAERMGSSTSSNQNVVVVVLSHPTRYMTNDIPYPFHQNQDFLYLTGILEPDSALILHGRRRPDQAILFVPRRDPSRELWDGPRSGRNGAAALTGIERVHCTEELGVVLKSLKGVKQQAAILFVRTLADRQNRDRDNRLKAPVDPEPLQAD
uniref:Aminopeptidase P N-terminal domain-containing protein n=1 Tax=Knipowitschia caucasica TaxID=637954 RepID=A0AAV2KL39_KNICA